MKYILTNNTVTLFAANRPMVVSRDHHKWDQILEAIKANDEETVVRLINTAETIKGYVVGNGIELRHNQIFYHGQPLHSGLTKRLLQMRDDGFPINHMLAFLGNLMQNPSNSAVEELYDFLEACSLPITEDGYFVAYKRIRADWTDVHSGKYDNRVGAKPNMPRNLVDDRRENTCSDGLHVCSLNYLAHFGGERLVLCKVNPRDVVSIPSDYGNTKMRVCQYEVVQELDLNTITEFDASLKSVYMSEEYNMYDDIENEEDNEEEFYNGDFEDFEDGSE
jgi:hypothetical protein